MSSADLWTDPAHERIAQLVRARTGLVFPPNRQASAESAIRTAMSRVAMTRAEDYLCALEQGGAVLDDLVAELTVGESYFFREPVQFDFIRRVVLPEMIRDRGPQHSIRVWSAGSASGEEPYTLAIVLHQAGLLPGARILGTEISRPRLAAARQGRYRQWALRGVPDDVVRAYFGVHGQQVVLEATIRSAVEFRYLNLAEDTYPASSTGIWGMDLILCRNVLIYFDEPTIRRVAARLLDSLSDGGWLFLGASDPPLADLIPCDVVATGAGLAYRRRRRQSAVRTRLEDAPATARATSAPGAAESISPPATASRPAPAAATTEPDRTRPTRADEAFPSDAADAHAITSAYAARNYELVIDLARSATARDLRDPTVWILLVRALANVGRLEEAGAACATALDRHRMSAELLYLHSLLLGETGRYRDAAQAARRALYLDRGLIVAHLALAAALTRLDDAQGARGALANAQALLAKLSRTTIVPASDGESAFRLSEIARAQHALLAGAVG